MPHVIYLACEPNNRPPWTCGNVVVYGFTAGFLRWIFETRKAALQAVGDQSGPCKLERVVFSVLAGEWLVDVTLPDDVDLEGDWVELAEDWSGADSDGLVPTEGWTLSLTPSDIRFYFYERHLDDELETPELTFEQLEELLGRLEAMTER